MDEHEDHHCAQCGILPCDCAEDLGPDEDGCALCSTCHEANAEEAGDLA